MVPSPFSPSCTPFSHENRTAWSGTMRSMQVWISSPFSFWSVFGAGVNIGYQKKKRQRDFIVQAPFTLPSASQMDQGNGEIIVPFSAFCNHEMLLKNQRQLFLTILLNIMCALILRCCVLNSS
jgi:hypothetical protein